MPDSPLSITPNSGGAAVDVVYVRRSVRHVAVSDSELHSISTMNTLTALFISASSSLLFFTLGILQVAWMEGGLSAQGTATAKLLVPLLIALSIIFAIAAGLTWRSRRSHLQTIQDESEDAFPR